MMTRYLNLFKFEMKNILKDSMTVVLLIYPLLIIGLGAFVLPVLLKRYGGDTPGTITAGLVMIVVFATVAPFITAALLGFGLLDNRDENTLDTIRVTPLSLKGYLIFKSVYAYVLSVNASFFSVMGTKWLSGDGYTIMGIDLFAEFTVGTVFIYALVGGLFTPVFGLFLAAVAKNKIEGFAYMKSAGMIVIVPALIVLETMQDAKQYLLGIIPIFWPVKGLLKMSIPDFLHNPADLPAWLYPLIGAAYMILLIGIAYRFFEKKVQH
ncbi:MAG: hypothetical protein EA374_02770 [Acholeplasmatales bacterium]|nr:MAG: hypothetical protein EA374_02770 [Acholeplasmatales bacterium]